MFYFLAANPSQTVSAPASATEAVSATPLVLSGAGQTPETIKKVVEGYFSDVPLLVSVARCESHFRQFESDGTVKRGDVNKYDVGVMQINELYHKETAEKLGLNLNTLDGNLAYARYLYEHEGVTPWASSQKCWGKDAKKVAENN